jgi:opacity protein-like surface antigen
MCTLIRTSLALLMVATLAVPAFAQQDRFSVNTVLGPSFATVGNSFSATADLQLSLNNFASLVGEVGMLRHTPFADALLIAPPAANLAAERVNATHWNANVKVRPFESGRIRPYVTAGIGAFVADAIAGARTIDGVTHRDMRRASDFATNAGAGVTFWLTDWMGVGADYRVFSVFRNAPTEHVNRLTAGLTFSVK